MNNTMKRLKAVEARIAVMSADINDAGQALELFTRMFGKYEEKEVHRDGTQMLTWNKSAVQLMLNPKGMLEVYINKIGLDRFEGDFKNFAVLKAKLKPWASKNIHSIDKEIAALEKLRAALHTI